MCIHVLGRKTERVFSSPAQQNKALLFFLLKLLEPAALQSLDLNRIPNGALEEGNLRDFSS